MLSQVVTYQLLTVHRIASPTRKGANAVSISVPRRLLARSTLASVRLLDEDVHAHAASPLLDAMDRRVRFRQ